MSSGRLALVVTLGIATYLATLETERHAPRARARPASKSAAEAPPPFAIESPVAVAPPQVEPRPHPVLPLDAPPNPAPVDSASFSNQPLASTPLSSPPLSSVPFSSAPLSSVPPAAPPFVPPPASATAAMISLSTTVDQLSRRLADLTQEVERLNAWRAATEAAATRRAARPVRRDPEAGRVDTTAGAPPIRKPRPHAANDPGDILGLATVTDSLMKRIEKLED